MTRESDDCEHTLKISERSKKKKKKLEKIRKRKKNKSAPEKRSSRAAGNPVRRIERDVLEDRSLLWWR